MENAAEAEIRALCDRLGKAFTTKDLNGVMSCFVADDSMVVFDDNCPPRELRGITAWKKYLAGVLADISSGLEMEVSDMRITAEGNLAYSTFFVHTTFTWKARKIEHITRWTVVFRKIGEQWLIAHLHVSLPYNFEAGRIEMMATS